MLLTIVRISQLEHKYLFSILFNLLNFIGSLAVQWILGVLLMAWTWQSIHCKHEENVTICFLCCCLHRAPNSSQVPQYLPNELEFQKEDDDKSIFSGIVVNIEKNMHKSNRMRHYSHTNRDITMFNKSEIDDHQHSRLSGVPEYTVAQNYGINAIQKQISIQSTREHTTSLVDRNIKTTAVKMCIFHMEIFFKEPIIFSLMSSDKKFKLKDVAAQHLLHALGIHILCF